MGNEFHFYKLKSSGDWLHNDVNVLYYKSPLGPFLL